jgi:hypothetical protein
MNEIWTQDKIHILIGTAWLKYFTRHLVQVLAPNYKQHILSLAKARKVRYSLAVRYVKICLFEFNWVEGGVNFMKHFNRGASYWNLGTPGLELQEIAFPRYLQ